MLASPAPRRGCVHPARRAMPRVLARALAWTPVLACVLGWMLPAPALAQTVSRPTRILVAYASTTGNTERMAVAVAEGAAQVEGVQVTRKRVTEVTDADLLAADAIIVGTPVHNGGMAAPVKAFIDRWPFETLHDKVGAAFATAGGTSAGEELAQMQILSAMLVFRFVIVGGDSWLAPFGASAIVEEGKPATAPGVDAAALDKARALGARVARITSRLRH